MPDLPEDELERDALARITETLGDGQHFRFLVEARRDVYLILLWALHQRRLAHEVEVPHDDLLAEVGPQIEARLGLPYDAILFRQDLEQLRRWGVMRERIEPTRIRSLADRGRGKLLLRIDPKVSGLLAFLESQSSPTVRAVQELGANLLADIHGQLREAAACLRRALGAQRSAAAPEVTPGASPAGGPAALADASQPGDEEITRAMHLLYEADRASERIAEELVGVGDLLARFLTEPFRVDELQVLAVHLERYVERYLGVLHERGRAVRTALGHLSADRFAALWARGFALQREQLSALRLSLHDDGLFGLRTPDDLVEGLRRFFTPGAGLEALCRRINRRTREAIRRLQRHVEGVRLRNVRIEAIRARANELFALEGAGADAEGWAFVEALIAPVLTRTDARGGTPKQRAMPPRPARRHESQRPAFRGGLLEPKVGTPGAARDLELRRLAGLCERIEAMVLEGRPQARLSSGQLRALDDARALIGGLLAYHLRGGRARKHLTFSLAPAEGRARLEAKTFVLDLPDALIRRKQR